MLAVSPDGNDQIRGTHLQLSEGVPTETTPKKEVPVPSEDTTVK